MEETDLSFLRRFNGEVGLSSIYNKGNQSAQYNLNADAVYPRERWSAAVSYSSSFSSSTGSSSVTRNESQITGQHLLRWNNWYYAGLADFLQSSEQGIQLQSTFGGGIGRYFKNTNNTRISVYSGVAWQNIAYHEQLVPATNQQVTSALIVGKISLFRFDKTNLDVLAIVLPALSVDKPQHRPTGVLLHQEQDSFWFIRLSGDQRSQEQKEKEGLTNCSTPFCSLNARAHLLQYEFTDPGRESGHNHLSSGPYVRKSKTGSCIFVSKQILKALPRVLRLWSFGS